MPEVEGTDVGTSGDGGLDCAVGRRAGVRVWKRGRASERATRRVNAILNAADRYRATPSRPTITAIDGCNVGAISPTHWRPSSASVHDRLTTVSVVMYCPTALLRSGVRLSQRSDIVLIIIIGVHWTQDKILYIQIIIRSFLQWNFSGWSFQALSSLASKAWTLGTATTTSSREFHGFTTRTAKLNFLTSSRDCWVCSFNEWPLVYFDNASMLSQIAQHVLYWEVLGRFGVLYTRADEIDQKQFRKTFFGHHDGS